MTGERSIAVIVPLPSRSQINETATPLPQPLEEVIVGLDREPLNGPEQTWRHGVGHGRRS
jgi:hypothetical protein